MPLDRLDAGGRDRLLERRCGQGEGGRGHAGCGEHRRAGDRGNRFAGENAKVHGFLQVLDRLAIMHAPV
jgi:hypothetical protein